MEFLTLKVWIYWKTGSIYYIDCGRLLSRRALVGSTFVQHPSTLSNWKCHTGFFDEVEGLSVTVKMAQYLTYSGFHLVLDSAFSAWSGVDESICPSNKVLE
jgi:hypothetical protein